MAKNAVSWDLISQLSAEFIDIVRKLAWHILSCIGNFIAPAAAFWRCRGVFLYHDGTGRTHT